MIMDKGEAVVFFAFLIAKIFLFCSVIALVASFVMGTNVSTFTVLKVIIGLWVFYALIIGGIFLIAGVVAGIEKLRKKR